MSRLPKFAIGVLCASVLLIGLGCWLAFSSDASASEEKQVELTEKNPDLIFDQDGLYNVILPVGTPEQLKKYEGFKVSFNKDNKTPNYVAWQLLDRETKGEAGRSDKFWQDPEIEGCPDEFAYRRSGYDRGHLCPSADQKWSPEAMHDCFVMANICPQAPELNQRAWQTLETKERQWAKRDGAIWIVAGPIYNDSDNKTIGNFNVRVPGAFFKAFLALDVEHPRAIAFIYPNAAAPGNMQDYAMSVDQLEEITGYDFFSSLPDDLEESIEAKYSFTEWNKSK